MYERKSTITSSIQYCNVRNRRTAYGDMEDITDDRPSGICGDCIFSQEDISLTEKVLEAGRILDIRLIDHIILGEGDMFCSLRESGRISGWECTN